MSLELPGWTCRRCGVFNGEMKEPRASCRSCDETRELSRVVHKFKIPPSQGAFSLQMNRDAPILSVQWQDETLVVWALVDPFSDDTRRHFALVPTGLVFDAVDATYVDTFQVRVIHEPLVLHLFEFVHERTVKGGSLVRAESGIVESRTNMNPSPTVRDA